MTGDSAGDSRGGEGARGVSGWVGTGLFALLPFKSRRLVESSLRLLLEAPALLLVLLNQGGDRSQDVWSPRLANRSPLTGLGVRTGILRRIYTLWYIGQKYNYS